MKKNVTITNGMTKKDRIEDFYKNCDSFHFTSRELIELETNLNMFVDEYREHLDDQYLFFLETLQAKMRGYIYRAQHFERFTHQYFDIEYK